MLKVLDRCFSISSILRARSATARDLNVSEISYREKDEIDIESILRNAHESVFALADISIRMYDKFE